MKKIGNFKLILIEYESKFYVYFPAEIILQQIFLFSRKKHRGALLSVFWAEQLLFNDPGLEMLGIGSYL